MPAEPVASPRDGPRDPYAPPQVDVHDHWGTGDPEMEQIRRAHVAEESYVKFIIIINIAYVLFYCVDGLYYLGILATHMAGRISVPWTNRPDWIAARIDQWGIVVFGIVAALGLRNRRKWAFRAEALLVLCLIGLMPIGVLRDVRSNTFSFLEFMGVSLFFLALAAPTFNLLDLRNSLVFEKDYERVVAATPHIKVKAKLPLDLIVIMVLLSVGSVVLLYLSSWVN